MGFKFAITIDNENFGRYADEAQIIRGVLSADGSINIAAHILDKKIFMADCLKPRRSFSFKFIIG